MQRQVTLATFALILLLGVRPCLAQGTVLWQQTLNGTANSGDATNSVAVDHQGNVLAAGYTSNIGTGPDFTVAKFARDGTLLWQQAISGTANTVDQAMSVAVDRQGNVVAAGTTSNTGTGDDFTVAKFARDGTLLWQQTINGTINGGDHAASVAVDNQGNVLAAGLTGNIGASGIPTGSDFTVAKFASDDGTLLWQQILNGTVSNSIDAAVSVAVDSQGNAVAAGWTVNAATPQPLNNFTVAKFGRDGNLIWRLDLNGMATSVAVDTQGNVLAAGQFLFTVDKFARDGTLLWESFIGSVNANSTARSLATDSQGNVLAAGDTLGGLPQARSVDFMVAKFDRDGTVLWQQILNGTANGFDAARSVAVDNQGNVLAAGRTQNTGTGSDFTVAKFARDGTLLWQQIINGTANVGDSASSVAVDNQGNVIAAGMTQNTGSGSDFTVAKFAP